MTEHERAALIQEMKAFVRAEKAQPSETARTSSPLSCYLALAFTVLTLALITYFQLWWLVVVLVLGWLVIASWRGGSPKRIEAPRKDCQVHGGSLVETQVWQELVLRRIKRDPVFERLVGKFCPNSVDLYWYSLEPLEYGSPEKLFYCPRCQEARDVLSQSYSQVRGPKPER